MQVEVVREKNGIKVKVSVTLPGVNELGFPGLKSELNLRVGRQAGILLEDLDREPVRAGSKSTQRPYRRRWRTRDIRVRVDATVESRVAATVVDSMMGDSLGSLQQLPQVLRLTWHCVGDDSLRDPAPWLAVSSCEIAGGVFGRHERLRHRSKQGRRAYMHPRLFPTLSCVCHTYPGWM